MSLLVIGLAGCSTNYPPQAITPLPGVDQEAARKGLREADVAFGKVSERKGVAQAFYQFLAPDATVLLPGERAIKGRDAIRVHLSALPAGVWIWKVVGTEVSRGADLGYTWGDYDLRSKTGDPSQSGYGKYVTVWKKQEDGSWKIVTHANNPSPPLNERR